MRNLTPGPKFSVLLAIMLLITLAVWPIGYAKAEKTAVGESQKEKRNAEEGKVSVKVHRSANFADQPPEKSAFYKKWETGNDLLGEDDDLYSNQADPSGSDSYEGDGYGYDDDEYDHFNYKRYDNGNSKLNRDVTTSNEEDKNSQGGEKSGNVVAPEATTIELLSFQAKNMNPVAENAPESKEDVKVKQFSSKNPPFSEKAEDKESLLDEKVKKKTSDEQKSEGNASDKNTGNVKFSDNKGTETKETAENKVEKGKISDSGSNGQTNVPNLKENVQIEEGRENSASVTDGKNDGKLTEKELKTVEVKIQPEEKEGVKMKAEKEMEGNISEGKVDGEAAKEESNEKNLSQFADGSEYKDRFVNMNDPVLTDDEKGSEDNGMNLAGLRDSRNELPYQYPHGFRFLKKKEAGRRVPEARSTFERESGGGRNTKEPFHLEFPLAPMENADYRRNYVKSVQRFKNMDDSARILGQGDTPSPYADESKKQLASKVIEEEQRKRRSRLRRLKPNPMYFHKRDREDEEEDVYGYDPRARMNYGMYRRNVFADGYTHPGKNYRRRGNNQFVDAYGSVDQFEDEETKNVKNKREDDASFYSDKRKNQGKNGWSAEESGQKKKLKELNFYEEPSKYNTPLVLLRRNDNGQQAIKTFVDGRCRNEEGIDSEGLARILSRDSNYVVLKKVPEKDQLIDGGRWRSGIGDSRKEKSKIGLTVDGYHPEEQDLDKTLEKVKDGRGERPLKGKENRIEDLSDFFKGDAQDDKDLDEKKEMLMSIDNRLNLYQKGEPNKKIMYQSPLSQAYRHMKDLEEAEKESDGSLTTVKLNDKKVEKIASGGANPERLMKSYKKDGKEFLVVKKPFSGLTLKGKSQDSMMQSSAAPGMGNVSPMNAGSGNFAQTPSMFSNGVMSGASIVPGNMYQNVMMPGNSFQEIQLPKMQNGPEGNRKYFLYGSENMSNSPQREVKVMQGGFSLPPGSPYNTESYNIFNSQTYNKASPMKNSQGGKAQSFLESRRDSQYATKPSYDYGKNQQCMANGYQPTSGNVPTAEGFKRLTKKEELPGGLDRFMRDFQDFSQASYPNTYKSTDLPEMSLQELTARGDKHLQKLNNLLKEIMSNKPEEGGGERSKNLKRGMFQKYKDHGNNWQITGNGREGADLQVQSGKWTSVVYDGSNQMGYSGDKNTSPGQSLLQERKLQGKDAAAMVSKDTLSSRRMKRQSGYDSKDSTKILEQKVKSTPYHVQPQPLFPTATTNSNTNQQHKSASKICLQLPPEKLMDLLSYYRSEREETGETDISNAALCRRHAPTEEKPPARRLMSLSENETPTETDEGTPECVRKSFDSYLEPLVRKLEEYEMKTKEERNRRRAKREIELDESMPNDFQNFLVTSLGELGSQKREVVKKDEAVWDSSENRGESILGKRDTSGNAKTEKKSIAKEEATNIRIKIVDGNGNGDLQAKASADGTSKDAKVAELDSNGDSRVHQVYLITNDDSTKRKKKKFATLTSDQSPQKQPISNHLPQVETVYNPSPGNNKAQMEKIISVDTPLRGKCIQPPTVYNASASMMEDNIIRNNLRTGNINTFTYQQKEEPTPYPLQDPTNPPSSEFEMLNSKTLPRSKSFNSRLLDHFTTSGLADSNPEIIYKDEIPGQYSNGKNGGARQVYRSNPDVRVLKKGAETSKADRYRKDDGEEESSYAEYEDGYSDGIADRENGKDGYRQEDQEEYPRAEEHLDPKMVAVWQDYARTHLSPERHKEAMEREFQEAYFRSNGQVRYAGGNLNQPNFGVNLIPKDFDELDSVKTREKLTKRVSTGSMASQSLPIGRRFFYTFKSEVPDEEYYALYQDSSKLKNSAQSGKVRLMTNQQLAKSDPVSKRMNSDNLQGSRVKRSEKGAKSEENSKVEKRLFSGHLTETHFRKPHNKNVNVKREQEEEEEEEEEEERVKRDTLAEFLKADMMRRIEEEKKIRSKVKGLSSDLTKSDIPLIESSTPTDVSLPDFLLQRLEEERKEKVIGQNSYLEDQQQQQQQQQQQLGNLKSGSPDVLKTFEIKRGRRENGQHSIAGRDELESYQDRVFLKGVAPRKVKKYSDEGFEPLTPDSRFSEKWSVHSETNKGFEDPSGGLPEEKEKENSSSSVNRRAGDKKSKLKDAGVEGDQQKFQKMTHGFSHEAPLLTHYSSLNSPKIFDALKDKDNPPQGKEDLSLRKHQTESSLLDPAETPFKSRKELTPQAKEPLVNAVLVLTKLEEPSGRSVETVEGSDVPSGGQEENPYKVEKRRADWIRTDSDSSRLKPIGQSPEIVNEEGECRSCGCETPTKTFNNKMAHNVKQSCFPFSQFHNGRNRGGAGIGNCGEEILESILGTVESNPHFRRVIGPGLKWRNRKCYTQAEMQPGREYNPSNQCLFVRQVRKILARFVSDIENLASQDFTRNFCCKLDSRSGRFLHELLAVPVEPSENCNRRKFLGSLLKESSGSLPRLNNPEDVSFRSASVEATENRRNLVSKLLEEYRNLPDGEKKSVEILGQYLNHELNSLNRALNLNGGSPAESDKKFEEAENSAICRGEDRANSKNAELPANAFPERDKNWKRASVKVPQSWSNLEDMKDTMDSYQRVSRPLSRTKEFPSTEKAITGFLYESGVTPSPHRPEATSPQPKRRLGELDKLGYGDAAGLQQSLKSHGPWQSNLSLRKGKPADALQLPEKKPEVPSNPATEIPSQEDSVQFHLPNGNQSDSNYGLEYQDYNDYDLYQPQNAQDFKRRDKTTSGGSRSAIFP